MPICVHGSLQIGGAASVACDVQGTVLECRVSRGQGGLEASESELKQIEELEARER